MPYLVFLLASATGAASLVWFGRRGTWRAGVLASATAALAAIIAWLLEIPGASGRPGALSGVVATLSAAIAIPGVAGAVVTRLRRSGVMLAAAVTVALALWLPIVYAGLFPLCELDLRCDL